GYYLHITCYLPKNKYYFSNLVDRDIGIDFGVGWKLTLSNGIKIDFEIHETPRLKRLQRKLAKTKKGSRNRKKSSVSSEKRIRKADQQA
ncbi:MAG: RNA-guided endonuclease InsQ/TnpB family protein, partial [Brevinematia bacterium]